MSDIDPLKKLTSTLTNKYRINSKQILDSCINNPLLGDLRPSEMLKKLQNKLEIIQPNITSTDNPQLLKECFLRSLPNDTRRILAATNTVSLEDLATIADKIHEEHQPNINNLNKRAKTPIENNESLRIMSKMIDTQNEMIKQFNQMIIENKHILNEIKNIKENIMNINKLKCSRPCYNNNNNRNR